MRTALIGLGMVAGTYGDAIRNSRTVSLSKVHARSPGLARNEWPDLNAVAAGTIEDIAADPD